MGKPILVASGLDWEFIQGRKEGDVRAELAERIRNSRTPPEQRTEEDIVVETRRKSGIKEFDGPKSSLPITFSYLCSYQFAYSSLSSCYRAASSRYFLFLFSWGAQVIVFLGAKANSTVSRMEPRK